MSPTHNSFSFFDTWIGIELGFVEGLFFLAARFEVSAVLLRVRDLPGNREGVSP